MDTTFSTHEVAPGLRALLRATMWSAVVLGVVGVGYGVFTTPASNGSKTAIAVAAGCAGAASLLWLIDRAWFAPYIRLCSDRIEQVFPSGKVISLPWFAISEIRRNEVMQRLELRTANAEQVIRVEYQLVGFEDVRQKLEQAACNATWR